MHDSSFDSVYSIPSALANQALYNSQEELNQPKEATMQVPTPAPAFDLNALLLAAITPVITQITAPLVERIKYLENHSAAAVRNTFTLSQRIRELESQSEIVRDYITAEKPNNDLASRMALLEDKFDNITTASDEHIRMIAIEEVEEQMAAHHNSYDHDEYDRLFNDLGDKIDDAINDFDISDKISEAINDFDFEDKINDALRSATISISV